MNNFYVYIHRRKSDNNVFYVGKGKNKRAHSIHGRNARWNNTYKKHGLIVEIVYDNLSETEAFTLETEVITEMKYHFESYLCNLTSGGEGVSGYKWTEENLIKHPSRMLVGKKLSSEHKSKISEGLIGRKISDTARSSISASNKIAYIPVRVFNLMKKALLKKPMVNLNYLENITGIEAKKLYRKVPSKGFSREAIEKSAILRRGVPSWNSGKKLPESVGIGNNSADKNIYNFIRLSDKYVFIGTRYDLCNTFNLNLQNIGKLFYKKSALSSQGWSLLKE